MSCRFALVMILFCSSLVASSASASQGAARPVLKASGPSIVRLVSEKGVYRLLRDGKPYFIQGAGGDGSQALLRNVGGNSIRTWGADNLGTVLDEAQRNGLTVAAGIWLGHREHGFDYNNASRVAAQFESARQTILKYRDHPALLIWSIGNEMEGYAKGDDPKIWAAVNDIAAMAKRLDPNHPTMTVIAEIGGERVQSIQKLCPAIDIIGINSYGGGPTLARRYRAIGGVKPYVLTEYGPPGVWEIGKNEWGAAEELTSTAKAALYRKTCEGSINGQPLCLGGYAFTWGHKQEATATWFGMLLPDGSRLGAVDALQTLWTGKPPAHPCPVMNNLKVVDSPQIDPGASIHATLAVTSPKGDTLKARWVLQTDGQKYRSNGDAEAAQRSLADAIVRADLAGADVKMPMQLGEYRLYANVTDSHGGAAVGNIPLLVRINAPISRPAVLPFVIYSEAESDAVPFAPSGYMGNTGAIRMDGKCADRPHSGKTCLQVQYRASDNWGGMVWQSPANDWGDRAGGVNLTGATQLTFWARGEKGGETVTFLCGTIGHDKPYYDTVQTKLEHVALTSDWKHYTIDLKGKNLTRIKTAFGWVVAGLGAPITFYLDDIRYE